MRLLYLTNEFGLNQLHAKVVLLVVNLLTPNKNLEKKSINIQNTRNGCGKSKLIRIGRLVPSCLSESLKQMSRRINIKSDSDVVSDGIDRQSAGVRDSTSPGQVSRQSVRSKWDKHEIKKQDLRPGDLVSNFADARQASAYILDIAVPLRNVASRAGLDFLAYLLDMVAEEADGQSRNTEKAITQQSATRRSVG